MNYDGIIQKYKGTDEIEFVKVTKRSRIDGHWKVREIETNRGTMYIVESDVANSADDVLGIIGKSGGSASSLFEVKSQISNFENSDVYKHSMDKKTPDDWDNLKKFANDVFASNNKYFTFLAGV